MEEFFEAKMKWSIARVGGEMELEDGRVLRIISISKIEWRGDRNLFVTGIGIPINGVRTKYT